ncbi:pi31 proteasome regulator [Trichoderma arundinaceum]|uniref:Pi31 proteasome regulator n=1 Tax=Trichoderma arundinaceum TaxID=490622 RepID=A0A395NJ51_TRIAR|nr:pi31 proteasome regulator [Trichoderma arundinaceum]
MAEAPPLSADAVLKAMADALPTHQAGDDSSDLASSYEAIALLVHAYFASLDFRLCGFDEDKPIPECASLAPRLPSQWNNGFGSLSFVYKHKQSSMTFVIRIDRMGSKVEIRGLAVGAENIHRFEYTVRDIVQAKNLPVRIAFDANGNEDRTDLPEKLKKLFISDQAIERILHDTRVQIVQKLIPKLQKEGYVETETEEAEANARDERRAQEARGDPRAPFRPAGNPEPNMPYPHPGLLPDNAHRRPPPGDFPPPDFEDEHEIHSPPRMMGGLRMPPSFIGHDDLNPPGLGPHDPLRGSFVGGGLPRPGGFSGMHPTFDDPLFTGEGGWGGQGQGQGGYDPQAPPGSRWDPVDPSGGPRFSRPGGRDGGGGGRGGFGGAGGFGGFGGFGSGDII